MGAEQKVAIITGASQGLGEAILKGYRDRNWRVVANSRNIKPSTDPDVLTVAGDIGDPEVAERTVKQALGHFGRIDTLVNNAGILRDMIFHKMSVEAFEAVIKVHLMGSFYVSHAAARIYREQEQGSFVHFTSTSGLIGNYGQANYAAAKLGIVGLSKSIALDMGRFNVRSNCVSPFAWTRMIGTIPTETDAQKARVEKIKQMGPEKIAPVCAYLLSDAAKDVTGQIFGVRMNEIFLFGQHRPVRSVHRGEGWTPETIAEHGMPALKASFSPLDRSADVFTWDPI